ncbi:carbon storage regulator [Pseudomonas aeruginosa]|uniref:carbon storage regulator n=1 Tax=Pseudomonas aeruginosa TaxID=287 RepID=UPI0021E13443|nr:carbon storage regulator [Pseudomonas aeruginosa]MCO2224983.1 carbon storage regulator [Pseudomonas aeruginosa]MCO2243707.1 carbon storage regulator [Pseudomonas aeruginosa]MCO2269053.1 carbon storage regulator [Pseudomonas aeruginosa]MCO2296634.1 carbon storage regulator [Pseudomonas aeruginosa]MCO2459119.1 carbon storage regulator [Pseudomonas aeruginosa]
MSYLVLQRHANEQILPTANPDVSDEDLIRHIREQGIALCVSKIRAKTASIAISAPESMTVLRAELLTPWT